MRRQLQYDDAVEIERVGDITILALEGEFDAVNLSPATKQLEDLIESGDRKLIFNFHNLRLIDSSALGCLIRTHKKLAELDGECVLSEPSKVIHSAITTLGMDRFFKTFQSNHDAVEYFRHGDDS